MTAKYAFDIFIDERLGTHNDNDLFQKQLTLKELYRKILDSCVLGENILDLLVRTCLVSEKKR